MAQITIVYDDGSSITWEVTASEATELHCTMPNGGVFGQTDYRADD